MGGTWTRTCPCTIGKQSRYERLCNSFGHFATARFSMARNRAALTRVLQSSRDIPRVIKPVTLTTRRLNVIVSTPGNYTVIDIVPWLTISPPLVCMENQRNLHALLRSACKVSQFQNFVSLAEKQADIYVCKFTSLRWKLLLENGLRVYIGR